MAHTIWVAMQTEAFRTVVTLFVLTALTGVAIAALALIAEHTRVHAENSRKLHMQQANIIRMLLRAGFRPARAGAEDWFDNGLQTQALGEESPFDTQWDLRRPGRL